MKKEKNKVDIKKFDRKSVIFIYWIFQIFLIASFITSFILTLTTNNQTEKVNNQSHAFISLLAIVIFNVPTFLKKTFKLYIPSIFQIIALIFIWAHFVLGDMASIYETSAVFDKILHTTSGIAIAALGFSFINIFNQSKNTHLKLSPFFVAFFAFCFSVMIATVWEIYEFFFDCISGNNMQRYIPPAPLVKDVPPIQGYGLIDTMGDLIVASIGSLITSVLGYISLKTKNDLLNSFMIRRMPSLEYAYEEAIESKDYKLAERIKKEIEARKE